MVKGKIKIKEQVPQLMDALHCKVSDHQRFLLRQSWGHLVYLEHVIQELDMAIDEHPKPYQLEIELIESIPGVERTTAASILTEIGADMS